MSTAGRPHRIDEATGYGDLHGRAEALSGGLPALLVAAERVARTVAQGVHGRRRRGQGETFWQFRRYQFGDSIQRVDWRQTAKSDHVYIRETEWEAAQSVWLWCDDSPSMDFASADRLPTKRARATLLTLALGILLIRGGEHIALADTGDIPAGGPASLMTVAAALTASGGTRRGAHDALINRARRLPRHGRVVLVGDFLQPAFETRQLLRALAGLRIKGHILRIVDPAEESLPFNGRVMFADPEGAGDTLVDSVDASRPAYRGAWRRHGLELEDAARGAGWTLATHHTDRPAEEALLSLYLAVSGMTER